MPKYKDLYYILIDDDKKMYNCIEMKFSSAYWKEKIDEVLENEPNRSIRGYSVLKKNVGDPKNMFEDKKHTEEILIEPPKDISNQYNKNLPTYAKDADLNKIMIVNHNCKDKGKFGEMNLDYPGKEAWETEKHINGKYTAKCLKCEATISDSYNWYRD